MRKIFAILALWALFTPALPAAARESEAEPINPGVSEQGTRGQCPLAGFGAEPQEPISSPSSPPPSPFVVTEIVRNRDFLARRNALYGYEACALTDVKRLGVDRIGICLIEPSGFEVRIVCDVRTMECLYRDMTLPGQRRREALRRESVRITDAVRLAARAESIGKE